MSRSNYLQLRLSDVEQENYKRLADKESLSVSEWARNQLNWIIRIHNGEYSPDNATSQLLLKPLDCEDISNL